MKKQEAESVKGKGAETAETKKNMDIGVIYKATAQRLLLAIYNDTEAELRGLPDQRGEQPPSPLMGVTGQ